jgi:type I restriction enzyme M protein
METTIRSCHDSRERGTDHPPYFPSMTEPQGTSPLAVDAQVADRPTGRDRRAKRHGDPMTLEARLFAAADKLRNKIPPSRYQDLVLGLVFLKYVSDAFSEHQERLKAQLADPESEYFTTDDEERRAVMEDRDEYEAASIHWVPEPARWAGLQGAAKRADIGQCIDEAMDLIEHENQHLRGVLPKIYGSAGVPPRILGGLIDLFSGVGFTGNEHGDHDVLGRVYEYFLNRFGINYGGEHYTPRPIVRLLVEMTQPFNGRVYDPCCGSGGMFVQSREFVAQHGGRQLDQSIIGQEAVLDTWRLAKMNLAIRGIDANLGDRNADTFHEDLHPDKRAHFILANPPFNDSDWDGELLKDDPRWVYGTPPPGNANFAWVQHFIHHLTPDGTAGFVLANGALNTTDGGQDAIRRRMVEDGLVDCIVSLPDKLFYKTTIPVALWFVAKNRAGGRGLRDRRSETLFVDARRLGRMITQTVRTLGEDDIQTIANAYHSWRASTPEVPYADVAGFSRAANLDEIAANDFVLSPGRYVAPVSVDNRAAGAERIAALIEEIRIGLARNPSLEQLADRRLRRSRS